MRRYISTVNFPEFVKNPGSGLLDKLKENFDVQKYEEPPSEEDKIIDFLDAKPWRAPKIKHLKIQYRPQIDNWRELYRQPDDDTLYVYAVQEDMDVYSTSVPVDTWQFPWMWHKAKADR
jgi:hypothetical protein